MLTDADLGGDLNLIDAYNRRLRELEANFNRGGFIESLMRLDAEFLEKVNKVNVLLKINNF